MHKIIRKLKKTIAFLLVPVLSMTGVCLMSVPALAAGEGYSDIYRIYYLYGVGGNAKIDAMALAYGNQDGDISGNYAAVIKLGYQNSTLNLDLVNSQQLEEMIRSCVTTTQIDVNTFNEYMLASGASDDSLLFTERPVILDEINKAIGQNYMITTDNLLIFPDTLRYAAQKCGPGFVMHCDTTDDNNNISVRLSFNPSSATKGICPAGIADSTLMPNEMNQYQTWYANKFALVKLVQDGSFGMQVKVTARAEVQGMDTGNLHFYVVNPVTNKIAPLESPNYSFDDNGYITFYTHVGGDILITEGPLAQR